MSLPRHLRSFILPLTAAGIIPFLQIARFDPFRLEFNLPLLGLQLPLGLLLFGLGFALLITTVRLLARIGQGTLAPWDSTRRLVTQGPYAYVRNPMISGVLFMLVGEAVGSGSWAIAVWALLFLAINTLYFKLSEEPGLVQRFGQEYSDYRTRVPMWLPRLKPYTR
jgi:protein-S-isoprenylcysteine O-methyltransferase Ste14